MTKHRLQLRAICLLVLLVTPHAQVAGAAAVATPQIVPANAPNCPVTILDAMYHLTKIASLITYSTTMCAVNRGWYGFVLEGPNTDPTGGVLDNKQLGVFHNGRDCANNIVATLGLFGQTVADFEAMAFSCFGNQQGCGQSIAQSFQELMEGTSGLLNAITFCERPGGGPTVYYADTYDIPVNGFFCWLYVIRFGQRILKMSKYIDTALTVCPLTTAPTPVSTGAVAPTPTSTNATAPTPTATNSSSAATGNGTAPTPTNSGTAPTPTATGSAPTPTATLGASPGDGFALGSTPWQTIQQKQPFATLGSALDVSSAAERRLSATATESLPEEFLPGLEELKRIIPMVAAFSSRFGVKGPVELESHPALKDPDAFVEYVRNYVEAGRKEMAAHIANATAPILV